MVNVHCLHFLEKSQQDFILDQACKKAKRAYELAYICRLENSIMWKIPKSHTKKIKAQRLKYENAKKELIDFLQKIKI